MKASEVIEILQKAIAQHGDLPTTVPDGLYPSDPIEVNRVDLEIERFFGPGIVGRRKYGTKHLHLS